jgi:hypothetical protein
MLILDRIFRKDTEEQQEGVVALFSRSNGSGTLLVKDELIWKQKPRLDRF